MKDTGCCRFLLRYFCERKEAKSETSKVYNELDDTLSGNKLNIWVKASGVLNKFLNLYYWYSW